MPLYVVREDIVRMKVDAIVSAGSGNPEDLPTGGVEASIHAEAGPELRRALQELGGVREGEAVGTPGFDLPCGFVIHTAGPRWRGGHCGEEERLRACYRASLRLAAERGLQTVAFPLISAGEHGYPRAEAMRVARETIAEFLAGRDMTVYLTVFDRESYLLGEALFRDVKAYVDQHYVDMHSFARQRPPLAAASERPTAPCAPAGRDKLKSMSSLSCESIDIRRPAGGPSEDGDVPEELRQWLKRMDAGFSATLMRLIDERGMTDPECYRRANIDRRLFSKIRSNPGYTPRKPTVLALCIALELNLAETKDLLSRAGYSMSRSSKFDVIVEYFIVSGVYDVFAINAALLALDQPLLGNPE